MLLLFVCQRIIIWIRDIKKLLDLFIAYKGYPPHRFIANWLLLIVLNILIPF
jgi:hypothetical protein